MTILLCWVVGILFSISIYLLLNKNLVRVLLGIMLIGTSINLLILTVGRLSYNAPIFLDRTDHDYANALPQALILTAIVIGFGIISYSLVLITKVWQEFDTMNSDKLRGAERMTED